MNASWRTTLFGAGGLVAILASTASALFDGNSATNPDWTLLIASVSACIGLIFARDNKVSSETAGAK